MKVKLTKLQKNLIADQFSNNENATDQELIQFFSENGIDQAISKILIEKERENFFHMLNWNIDWSDYDGKVIVSHTQVKELFQKETGVSANEILEIHESFPAGYDIIIHTSNRTWIGRLDVNAKLKTGSLTEEK